MGPDTSFEFATASRVIFGWGAVADLPDLVAELAPQAMVITGSTPDRHAQILGRLRERVQVMTFELSGEPTVDDVERAFESVKEKPPGVVIGLGGGSVIDLAKAVAVRVTNAGPLRAYLELGQAPKPLSESPLPVIAVPTTAGTGAEVTRNAVLGVPDQAVKVSLRDRGMLPVVALVDPELTLGVPLDLTVSTGMDALTQLIEPFVSPMATPVTDAFCRDGIPRIFNHLPSVVTTPSDQAARSEMSLASLFGGLALANAKLGAVHGIAGPLGGMAPVPHGAACAALLVPVLKANLQAARASGNTRFLDRLSEVGGMLPSPVQDPEGVVEGITQWMAPFEVAGLGSHGLQAAQVSSLADKASRSSSMKGNPFALDRSTLEQVIQSAL